MITTAGIIKYWDLEKGK